MKLMIICLVFVVVCGKINGEYLKCVFKDLGSVYNCEVTSLENTNKTMVITGHSGFHKANKTDNDVQKIEIYNLNTKYIPKNLGNIFNLTKFTMERARLVEIKSQDFIGMENLEFIGFFNNRLTTVPIDAFSTLTKLIEIDLAGNQLEELQNGVFDNNPELKRIHLYNNKIKFIGSSLFGGLTKLNYVWLQNNICMNKNYQGSSEIIQLKKRISLKCKNPIESVTEQDLNYMEEKIKKLEAKLLKENKKKQKMEQMEKENVEFYDKKSQLMYKHEKEMNEFKSLIKQFKEEVEEFCNC